MHREVNTIANLMSLRPPQRRSLEILDRVSEIISLQKDADRQNNLDIIRKEFPSVSDFERDFASLCFALATGVGKTRLMGAFISYLHLAHGFNNFFVLAPNLTIYDKLINDFKPGTSKYVFNGISQFAINPPNIITGDNYDQHGPRSIYDLTRQININIFNISKINSEVRGGKSPRIKRLSEYIGDSYFNYLAELKDLVLIMDESHRYRASAGARAINELKPVIGLELTATPFVEATRVTTQFKNVIYDYPLAKAMADGFVKEPAVVTQKNFDPLQHTPEEIERIKLQDGIHMHEDVKVELKTYAEQMGVRRVKPFMLIIARDTTHAGQLSEFIKSDQFFQGQYKDKVIQVDSSRTGAEEDEMVKRLLAVESPDEPTEIVIHVNMLKEGWDVTNLYTIVPLRAANARTLIEQSIGRGLRLPYGKRTKVAAIDRLSIIAHDKFQEIIDEANKTDSVIHLQQIILDPEKDMQKMEAITVQPNIVTKLGATSVTGSSATTISLMNHADNEVEFTTQVEQRIAQLTYQQIVEKHEDLPSSSHLLQTNVIQQIEQEVIEMMIPSQLELPETAVKPDVGKIVTKVAQLIVQNTIDIPRIVIVPKEEPTIDYHPFQLDTSSINYQPVEQDILIQTLRTRESETLRVNSRVQLEKRLEDYLVFELMEFDDINYDKHSDLLYDLSGQIVSHLKSYLPDEIAIKNVLAFNQKRLAKFIHAQMLSHQWEKSVGYKVNVSKGYTKLLAPTLKIPVGTEPLNFRLPVLDKRSISQLIFGGFKRCLYPVQKFDSDPERKMAVILDRDSQKWFRPLIGQFKIDYKVGHDHREYQPDFTAEADESIFMVEVKASNELNNTEVQAKKDSAIEWCRYATDHTLKNGGKRWEYLLIPHDSIAENMDLLGLAGQFTIK